MTIKTIADLAWALGHCIEVKITDAADTQSNNAVFDAANVPTPKATSIAMLRAGNWDKTRPVIMKSAVLGKQLVSA